VLNRYVKYDKGKHYDEYFNFFFSFFLYLPYCFSTVGDMASFYIYPVYPFGETDFEVAHYPNTPDVESYILSQSQTPRKRATQEELNTLKKIRKKGRVCSDRARNKEKRRKYVQTPMGMAERHKKIKKAVEALKRAKREDVPPSAPGRRRVFKVVAKDVQKWLAVKKIGNFCLNTIKTDLALIRG